MREWVQSVIRRRDRTREEEEDKTKVATKLVKKNKGEKRKKKFYFLSIFDKQKKVGEVHDEYTHTQLG